MNKKATSTLAVGDTFAEGGTIVKIGSKVTYRGTLYVEVFVDLGTGTGRIHRRRYNNAGTVTVL